MQDDRRGPPPNERLMQFITGHWVAAAVHAAARLGIADQLRDGPKPSDELAAAVGAHASSLYRLLRALATLGVLDETETGQFALNDVGNLLRSDHPRSMRSMALFQGADPHWRGWGSFLHSVRTGEPAFAHVHGMGFFDYCQTDEEFAAAFNGAMTGMSALAAEAVVEAYDFSGIERLVDVGGGHGYLLSSILQNNPEMRGVVFDLPHVASGAHATMEAAGLSDRCEVIGGDFFASVPPANAYIAKNIIHDWDDERAVTILKNMRSSLDDKGRVLLVEAVITDDTRRSMAILIDLEMLHATHGGRERSKDEFAELFAASGLRLQRVIETKSPFCIVEAVAAA